MHSCASLNPKLKDQIVLEENKQQPIFKMYLIGDVGKPDKGYTPTALKALEKEIINADSSDLLLFLGDNVYPKGIPESNSPEKSDAEFALSLQINVAKKFPGRVIFIPGNHDWYSGISGLYQQELLVKEALGTNTFLPENGCAIKKVKINDETILLVVDSQWYITNWDKHPTINDNCEIKTRTDFLDEFRSEIKKARGKTVLVAIHHPMFTNGSHGGYYSLKDHLQPFPIIGSLKNLFRNTSGISNVRYNLLVIIQSIQ